MYKPLDIALISIFAGLMYIFTLLPGIPIVGGRGKIEIAVSLTPIYGILLGPWRGGLATLLGFLIAVISPPGTPNIFSALMIIPPTTSTIISGLIVGKKFLKIEGWVFASIIQAFLILLWYLNDIGINAPLYPIIHISALILLIFFNSRLKRYLDSNIFIKRFTSVFITSLNGILSDHMTGNLIFIHSIGLFISLKTISKWLKALGLPNISSLFMYMLPISIIERISLTILATTIGLPIYLTLHKTKYWKTIRSQ